MLINRKVVSNFWIFPPNFSKSKLVDPQIWGYTRISNSKWLMGAGFSLQSTRSEFSFHPFWGGTQQHDRRTDANHFSDRILFFVENLKIFGNFRFFQITLKPENFGIFGFFEIFKKNRSEKWFASVLRSCFCVPPKNGWQQTLKRVLCELNTRPHFNLGFLGFFRGCWIFLLVYRCRI